MTTVLVLADTGDGDFHVGDEAMLAANVAWLRAAGADVRVAGRDEDAAAALAAADAALVSGGGNLAVTWPELLEQRIGLLEAAAALGRPVVLGGQTLGPELGDRREALAAALRGAAAVGVRDRTSAALARELGIPAGRLLEQTDDAWDLTPAAAGGPALPEPFMAVTLDGSLAKPGGRLLLLRLASQLVTAARDLGLAIVFQPHVGPLGAVGDEDGAAGERLAVLARAAGVECVVTPVLGVRETVSVTRRASLVASSRYHPLVFATAAGIPALGVHTDAYTRAKLDGALTHVGAEEWLLERERAAEGSLAPALHALWERRTEVAAALRAAHTGLAAREADRKARLAALLGLAAPPAAPATPPVRPLRHVAPPRRGPAHDGISAEQWARFARDGFLPLGERLEPARVGALRARADDLARGRVANEDVRVRPGAAIEGLEADEVFWPLVTHPLILDACAWSYGRHAAVSLLEASVDEPRDAPGWRQAGAGRTLDRDPLVTVHVALDRGGALEVVRGSHALGLLPAVSDEHCPPGLIEPLPLPPGQAVLVHPWLIRRGGSAEGRVFTGCYADARTIDTRTGERFPVIHGASAPEPHGFIEEMQRDRVALRESFATCERYARSLEAELERIRTFAPADPPPARSRLGALMRRLRS